MPWHMGFTTFGEAVAVALGIDPSITRWMEIVVEEDAVPTVTVHQWIDGARTKEFVRVFSLSAWQEEESHD